MIVPILYDNANDVADFPQGDTATTTYTHLIQRTWLPAGLLKVYLITDIADPPSGNTNLIVDGELNERIDLIPFEIQVPEMAFRYYEDYSMEQDGFWFNRLNGEVFQLKILLDEGAGDTLFFWGKLLDKTPVLRELSLVDDAIIRQGEFRCISMITALQELDLNDLLDYLETNHLVRPTSGGWGYAPGIKMVSFNSIFSAMLFRSGLNPSFGLTDIEYLGDGNDFVYEYSYSGAPIPYVFDELYMPFQYDSGVGGWVRWGYSVRLQQDYESGYEVLGDLCRTFAVLPNFIYDIASSRWKIRFTTRGKSYQGTPITLPTPISSEMGINSDSVSSSVIINDVFQQSAWKTKTIEGFSADLYSPPGVKFDISQDILFGSPYLINLVDFTWLQWVFWGSTDGAAMQPITTAKYWDYEFGAYLGTNTIYAFALAKYLFKKFSRRSRWIDREYVSIQGTYSGDTTHSLIFLTACTSIDDGVSAKTYYATDITKNVFTNKCKIRWTEL